MDQQQSPDQILTTTTTPIVPSEQPSQCEGGDSSSQGSNDQTPLRNKATPIPHPHHYSHQPSRLPLSGPEDPRLAELTAAYETIIRIVGKNPHDGLTKTPLRAAKAIMELTHGYETDLDTYLDAIFDSEIDFDQDLHDNFVIVRNIQFSSLCEHHLLPFAGTVHIGYIPTEGRILGLSKFGRITNHFSQRLQVQESLGHSIASGLFHSKLSPAGVIVMIDAEHSCMSCRGVRKCGASTTTTAMAGEISKEQRREFFMITQSGLDRR